MKVYLVYRIFEGANQHIAHMQDDGKELEMDDVKLGGDYARLVE